MSDNSTASRWTPPRWFNKMMIAMLKIPGLQRIAGRSTALLTFTSRKTEEPFTIPVSYVSIGDRILITGHRTRKWWPNLITNPDVEIRLAGKVRRGVASVLDDPDNAIETFVSILEAQPMIAKVNEVSITEGKADVAKSRQVLGHTVVISIKLEV